MDEAGGNGRRRVAGWRGETEEERGNEYIYMYICIHANIFSKQGINGAGGGRGGELRQ